jgi:DNA-binding transcriptional LysR family regulator
MDTLRALTAFVRSVELGSLSGAARSLDTTQPTISKMVAGLERSLGVRLLRRSATQLALTDEGQRFHERARRLLEEFDEAVADARAQAQQPRGLLRLSAPIALGQQKINGWMLEFLAQYPEIELDLLLEDRFVDPLEERIDVSLRLGGTLPPTLVARAVGQWPRLLVASPDYLAAHGKPRRPQDLVQHRYLRYAGGSDESVLLHGPEGELRLSLPSRYRVSNAISLTEAVLQGAGIALAPSWMVTSAIERGELVQLLPRYCGPAQSAHLLYAPRRHQPLRVRVLVDFLSERLAGLPATVNPALARAGREKRPQR